MIPGALERPHPAQAWRGRKADTPRQLHIGDAAVGLQFLQDGPVDGIEASAHVISGKSSSRLSRRCRGSDTSRPCPRHRNEPHELHRHSDRLLRRLARMTLPCRPDLLGSDRRQGRRRTAGAQRRRSARVSSRKSAASALDAPFSWLMPWGPDRPARASRAPHNSPLAPPFPGHSHRLGPPFSALSAVRQARLRRPDLYGLPEGPPHRALRPPISSGRRATTASAARTSSPP